jgi:branched-chain amino acid aminotransferase
MEMVVDIKTRKITESKFAEVDFDNLEFGKNISDHMYVCKYANRNWQIPQIIPFSDLQLSPATLALHYGQSVFEGMKAFKMIDGSINIFRIDKHWERLNISLKRMCMPSIPKQLFIDALQQLVDLDRMWVPSNEGSSLYLRPFVFASEERFGVKIAEEYLFIVFSGPVPPFYSKPLKVKVERNFIRAAKGGTGYAKCCGNYGAAFYPTQKAREEGYDQVLWTDASEHQYIEESGTMNVIFVIEDKLVTPALSDSILDGVTRESLITLAQEMNLQVEERRIGIDELKLAFLNKTITEAFGAGTAAVVAPIEIIGIDDRNYHLPAYTQSNIMFKLKERLENIRSGVDADKFNWNYIL